MFHSSPRLGLASAFSSSCWSGANFARGGCGMSRLESWKPAYTMISLVIFRYQRLCLNLKPQVKFNGDISFWTCISQFSKRYPGTIQSVTYPGISLWYFVWNRIQRVNLTKPDLYQLFIFSTGKCKQLIQVGTNVLVLGYPRISHRSSYPWISNLFLLNFQLSRDIPAVFV